MKKTLKHLNFELFKWRCNWNHLADETSTELQTFVYFAVTSGHLSVHVFSRTIAIQNVRAKLHLNFSEHPKSWT
jgi:hypothetical protein